MQALKRMCSNNGTLQQHGPRQALCTPVGEQAVVTHRLRAAPGAGLLTGRLTETPPSGLKGYTQGALSRATCYAASVHQHRWSAPHHHHPAQRQHLPTG